VTKTAETIVAILSESVDAAEMMRHAVDTLTQFGVSFRKEQLTSRDALTETIARFSDAGTAIFIIADSVPIPLSAEVARMTLKPVLAVPLESAGLPPLSALQSTTASDAPVASLAIGKAGAINAALLAISILANTSAELAQKLQAFRTQQTTKVLADVLE